MEDFIKIGITSKTVEQRFCKSAKMPYNYKTIVEIKGSAGFIYDLEKKMHKNIKNYDINLSCTSVELQSVLIVF